MSEALTDVLIDKELLDFSQKIFKLDKSFYKDEINGEQYRVLFNQELKASREVVKHIARHGELP